MKQGIKDKIVDSKSFTPEQMLLIDNGADVGPLLELLRELNQIVK